MVRVERLTTASAINALVPEWKDLWQRLPNATPFQSSEWLLTWWDCFGNAAPLVLTARHERELVGVLPLYCLEEAGYRRLLPIGISLSDYLDAIIDQHHSGAAHTLLGTLAELPGWDECHLPDLPPSAALLAADCPAALVEGRSRGETCPVLALPGTVDQLRELVPRKTLRDVRQARHHTTERATVTQADASNVAVYMQELFRLHEQRWQRIARQGVCADPVARRFHLTAAERMLDSGMLRLYLLQIGNSAVAAYYGFTAKRIAYAYLSGFHPDFAELSPGTQIVAHAIEEAIREGAREFHFLRGGETYKYAWGAIDRPNTTRILRRRC